MFKFVAIFAFTTISYTMAAPKADPSVFAAPVLAGPVAPAVVTAQSSQVIARNYNALAAPLVAPAPVVAAPVVRAAPVVASAPIVAPSPYFAPSPYIRAATPFVAPSPYLAPSPYVASPYLASPYSAPLVF